MQVRVSTRCQGRALVEARGNVVLPMAIAASRGAPSRHREAKARGGRTRMRPSCALGRCCTCSRCAVWSTHVVRACLRRATKVGSTARGRGSRGSAPHGACRLAHDRTVVGDDGRRRPQRGDTTDTKGAINRSRSLQPIPPKCTFGSPIFELFFSREVLQNHSDPSA